MIKTIIKFLYGIKSVRVKLERWIVGAHSMDHSYKIVY